MASAECRIIMYFFCFFFYQCLYFRRYFTVALTTMNYKFDSYTAISDKQPNFHVFFLTVQKTWRVKINTKLNHRNEKFEKSGPMVGRSERNTPMLLSVKRKSRKYFQGKFSPMMIYHLSLRKLTIGSLCRRYSCYFRLSDPILRIHPRSMLVYWNSWFFFLLLLSHL